MFIFVCPARLLHRDIIRSSILVQPQNLLCRNNSQLNRMPHPAAPTLHTNHSIALGRHALSPAPSYLPLAPVGSFPPLPYTFLGLVVPLPDFGQRIVG